MAKKKPKYQPSKWDWIKIEGEFLASDFMGVAKFIAFNYPMIPKASWERASVGWGEKKKLIREKGLEILKNKAAKRVAEMSESHFSLGSGVIKIGLDALAPVDAAGQLKEGGLKPKSAGEAAKMIQLGALIQNKAVGNVDPVKLATLSLLETPEGLPTAPGEQANPSPPLVQFVRVKLPDNGKNPRT